MIVYWNEDEKDGEEDGKIIYKRVEKSGILVSCHHTPHSGYPNCVIALVTGHFTTKPLFCLKHREPFKEFKKRNKHELNS